jgi:hypothetical protein
MAIPTTAKALPQPLDSKDVVDYKLTISKAGVDTEAFPILEADETVASWALNLTVEAMAAGLTISTAAGKEPILIGNLVLFWLSIDPAMIGNSMFNAGVTLAMELTVVTSGGRTKQRTATVKVIEQ